MADEGSDRTRTAGGDRPPGEPGDRIAALEAELAAARADAEQNRDRWLRERADLENLKKRAARERSETAHQAKADILKDLLPVVDNLERAVEHARGGGNGKPLIAGVELVLKGLLEVLERHGVRRVEAKGAPFDPAHHEAMAHVESAEHAPNSVVDEHQAGYRLHDRLLRPALVSVAKAPETPRRGGGDLAKDKGGD